MGVLQDVELVVDDLALWHPLLDAQPVRLPHVHTRGLDAAPLPATQLLPEELIQRLLLPLPPKPQRLGSFQVAHHSEKLLFLPHMDLVHAHWSQCRSAPLGRPSFQMA
jgi:hypothetical protein